MTTLLDISIGPVQGFVAQSRRTRDLWGSSYLLSFLAAHAMRGAREAGGRIVRPDVRDDRLFAWVDGRRNGEPPRIGTVPNHFVVELDGDAQAAATVAEAAAKSLDTAWQVAHSAVRLRFMRESEPLGDGTSTIWDRQVAGFWEVQWTAGEMRSEAGLLARRKHWRSHWPPDEPGDKCTVMPDYQELSGHVRARGGGSGQLQDDFWAAMRRHSNLLDLREDERLCAIALVKRLFPRIDEQSLGWEVDTAHWPSTAYVAAVPWIRVAAVAAPVQAHAYASAVRSRTQAAVAEQNPPFAQLTVPQAGYFTKLDANLYHRGFLADPRLCPIKGDEDGRIRRELTEQLRAIHGATTEAGTAIGAPPVFYALLLADGDHLGRMVGRLGGERVGRALSAFTAAVPGLVAESDGVTIYAGGDDVLAMLPVPQALSCADALARSYVESFAATAPDAGATLSAAVVFAHIRLPLSTVIAEAHRLLDEVAKDENGRASLAAAVLKRGGLHCQWVSTWQRPDAGGATIGAVYQIQQMVDRLGSAATEPGLSSSLLFRIRETLGLLCGWPRWAPGVGGILPSGMDLRAFLRAEILRSLPGDADADKQARADALAGLVQANLRPSRRATGASGGVSDAMDEAGASAQEVGVDGLLVARFLLSGGREEGGE